MVAFAFQPEIKRPRIRTLQKYGLTLSDWACMLAAQDNCCKVCKKVPASGRLCIDHEHVRGWKKMPWRQRRRFVRGIVCFVCNHYCLDRNMTLEKAQAVAEYLMDYKARSSQTFFS